RTGRRRTAVHRRAHGRRAGRTRTDPRPDTGRGHAGVLDPVAAGRDRPAGGGDRAADADGDAAAGRTVRHDRVPHRVGLLPARAGGRVAVPPDAAQVRLRRLAPARTATFPAEQGTGRTDADVVR